MYYNYTKQKELYIFLCPKKEIDVLNYTFHPYSMVIFWLMDFVTKLVLVTSMVHLLFVKESNVSLKLAYVSQCIGKMLCVSW